MSKFSVGDTVRLLDADGQGVVTRIVGEEIFVEIDGFELPFSSTQLIVVEHDSLIKSPIHEPKLSSKDKASRTKGREKLDHLNPQSHAVYELDLHIHELLDHYSGMSNGGILRYQMGRCKQFIQEAIQKRYRKVVLIHGVGEGVLKNEIHHFLDEVDRVSYHDAPYRTYGYGATEVIIHG